MSDPNQTNQDPYVNTGFLSNSGANVTTDPSHSGQSTHSIDPDSAAGNSMQDLIELNNQISKLEEQSSNNTKPQTPSPSPDPSKMKPENLDAQLNALSGLATPEEHQNKKNNPGVDSNSDFVNNQTDPFTPPVKGGDPVISLGEQTIDPSEESGTSNPFKKFASKFSGMKNELVVENQPKEKMSEHSTSGNQTESIPLVENLADPLTNSVDTSSDTSAESTSAQGSTPSDLDIPTKVDPVSDRSLQDLADQVASQISNEVTDPNSTPPSEIMDTSKISNDMEVIFDDNLPVENAINKLPSQAAPSTNMPLTATSATPDQSAITQEPLPKLSDIKDQIASENNEMQPLSSAPTMQDMSVAADPMGLKSNVSEIVQMDPNGQNSEAYSQATPPDSITMPQSVTPIAPVAQNPQPTHSENVNVNTVQNPAGVVSSTFVDKVTEDLAPTQTDKRSKYNYAEAEVKSSSKRYPYTIEQLLDIVVERDASDLHITVGYPAMIRVDGALVNVTEELVTPSQAVELVLPVLPEQKKELLDVNREVDLAYPHRQDARFRINAYYQKQTLAAAFRLIPNMIRSIDDLNLPQIYHKIVRLKQGLVLVTGPTGSGKSTTLAAIIQEINETRPDHIITIEDPVEYVFPKARAMVDQRELHEDTHSWEIALRSALRQDPDVMLVGEMRDYETIASAITLAETGHLVFATLHTNSAAQTLDRIVDVFPEHQQSQIRSQLSNTIEAVIAQRLIPLQRGGRAAVSEIMIATPAIRNLIREAKTHQIDNVIRTSADVGMISLEHTLVRMIRENLITMERAMEYAVHPEEIVRLMKS